MLNLPEIECPACGESFQSKLFAGRGTVEVVCPGCDRRIVIMASMGSDGRIVPTLTRRLPHAEDPCLN